MATLKSFQDLGGVYSAAYTGSVELICDFNDVVITEHRNKDFKRIVNWLRHERTNYDEILKHHSRYLKGEAHEILFRRMMIEIAYTFPKLASECKRQLRERGYDDKLIYY